MLIRPFRWYRGRNCSFVASQGPVKRVAFSLCFSFVLFGSLDDGEPKGPFESDFESCKKFMMERAVAFLKRSVESRQSIAKTVVERFVRDESVVLVHGGLRVVGYCGGGDSIDLAWEQDYHV